MNARTILVAEDDRFLRRACDAALRRRGYTTVLAENGEQALAMAKFAKPDLILLDILMPRMSGLEVLKGLRGDPDTHGIPVLILSNSSKDLEVRHASELGAIGYWIKANLSLKDLVDGIDQLWSGAQDGTAISPFAR